MTVAAGLKEGEVGGCDRRGVVSPPPGEAAGYHLVYLMQGWGLHIGLYHMACLEAVKSKPVHVPVDHSVKVRVDLGHHEIKLPGRARGEGSEFGRCAVGRSVGRV